jgi:hypothetical protein
VQHCEGIANLTIRTRLLRTLGQREHCQGTGKLVPLVVAQERLDARGVARNEPLDQVRLDALMRFACAWFATAIEVELGQLSLVAVRALDMLNTNVCQDVRGPFTHSR